MQMESEKEMDPAYMRQMYLRFIGMILSAMIVMYGLTYANTFVFDHLRWSEHRAFMSLIMGDAMALVMLGWMLGIYKNRAWNLAIIVGALVLVVTGWFLVRTETTVQDSSFMSSMIPHHSIAILAAERFEIADLRVCELAVEIIGSQQREIAEMDWLIEDIARNGVADSVSAAEARPVPEFTGTSLRVCSSES